jgi:hypothetical protein
MNLTRRRIDVLILKQIEDDKASTPPPDSTQTLNTMAALILGSPEFQLK